MQRAAHDRFVNIDVTIPDLKIKAAIRIGANPSFIADRCSLTAKIRQRHQITRIALLTLREINLFHGVLLPTENIKQTVSVYNNSYSLTSARPVMASIQTSTGIIIEEARCLTPASSSC